MEIPKGPGESLVYIGIAAGTAVAWFVWWIKTMAGKQTLSPSAKAFMDEMRKDLADLEKRIMARIESLEKTLHRAVEHAEEVHRAADRIIAEVQRDVAVIKSEVGHVQENHNKLENQVSECQQKLRRRK